MNQNQWGNGAQHKRKNRWEENEENGKRVRQSGEDTGMWSQNNQRRGSYSDARPGGSFGAQNNSGGHFNANRSLGGQFNANRQYNDDPTFGRQLSDRGHFDGSGTFGGQRHGDGQAWGMQHENREFSAENIRNPIFAKQDDGIRRNAPPSPKSLMNVDVYEEVGSGNPGNRISGASNLDGRNQNASGGLRPLMGVNMEERRNHDDLSDPFFQEGNASRLNQAGSHSRFGRNDANSLGDAGNDHSRFGHGDHGGNGQSFGRGGRTSRFGQDENTRDQSEHSANIVHGKKPSEPGRRDGSYGRGEEGRKVVGNTANFGFENGGGNFGNRQGRDRIGSVGDRRSSDFGRQTNSGVESPWSRTSQPRKPSENETFPPPSLDSFGERVSEPRLNQPKFPSPSEISDQSSFYSNVDRNRGGFGEKNNSDPIVTLRKLCENVNIDPQFSFFYTQNNKKIVCFCHVGKEDVDYPEYGYTEEEAKTKAANNAIQRLKESKETAKETETETKIIEKLKLDHSEALSKASSDITSLLAKNKDLKTDIQNLQSENKNLNCDKQTLESDKQKLESDKQKLDSDKQKLESENKELLSDNNLLKKSDNNMLKSVQSENESLRKENKNLYSEKEHLKREIGKNKNDTKCAGNCEFEIKQLKDSNKKLIEDKKYLNGRLTPLVKGNAMLDKNLKSQKETISKLESQKEDLEYQVTRLKSNHFETKDNNAKTVSPSNGRMKIPKINECTKESCQVIRRDLKLKSTQLKEMEDNKNQMNEAKRKQQEELKNVKEDYIKLEGNNNQVKRKLEDELKQQKEDYKMLDDSLKKSLDRNEKETLITEKETLITHFLIEESKIHLKIEVEETNIKIAKCEKEKSQFEDGLISLERNKSNGNSDVCKEIKKLTISLEQCDKMHTQLLLERTKLLADLEKLKKKIPKLQRKHKEVFRDFNTLNKKYDSIMQLRGLSSSAELENTVKHLIDKYTCLKEEIKVKDEELVKLRSL